MKKQFSIVQQITAFLMMLTVFSPTLLTAKETNQKTGKKSLTEDQKILHVLNRLGFGIRAGDVERVKTIGIGKYIEQQLDPASINDSIAVSKVKNLNVLNLSNEQLFAKYPNPAAVLQVVAQNNNLNRRDLQSLRRNNQNNAETEKNPNEMTEAERQEYQKQVVELYQKYNLGRPAQITQQLNASRIIRATYSERQLNEVMVDFWSNHFNVYAQKAATRWFLPEYDRDVIRPNAMGNFKDLLLATAKSPAMLFYLDNFESISPNAQNNNLANNNRRNQRIQNGNLNQRQRQRLKARYNLTDEQLDARLKQMRENQNQQQQQQQRQRRGINENYAREIMELHTLGVEGGYSQKDIQEIARCFTGWTIVDARGYRRAFADMATGTNNARAERLMRQAGIPVDTPSGTFYFNENWHDKGEKIVLGQKINEGGIKDGLKVIEILANHPSTAKFIAKKLAVKFVSDNPSQALIGRVADAFTKSKGDIKTTLRALFSDEEFFAAENYRAKIKTPFELLVSSLRTLGADTNGGQIQALLNKMGEQLYGYQAPTGYPDTAEDWVNTGALLERMNFAVALVSNRIPGTRVDLKKFEAKEKPQILQQSIAFVLSGEVNPNTKTMLLKQIEQPLIEPKLESQTGDENEMENQQMMNAQEGGGRNRQNQQARLLAPSGNAEVFKVVGLILGSPDFQRQ